MHIYVKERAYQQYLNQVTAMGYEELCDLVLQPTESMEQFEDIISDDDKFQHRLDQVFEYRWSLMTEEDRNEYVTTNDFITKMEHDVEEFKKTVLYPIRNW